MSSLARQHRDIAGRRVSESSKHKLQRIKYADSDEASDHERNGCWIDTVRFISLFCHLVPSPQLISNLLWPKGTHYERTFSSKLTCSYHFLCFSKSVCAMFEKEGIRRTGEKHEIAGIEMSRTGAAASCRNHTSLDHLGILIALAGASRSSSTNLSLAAFLGLPSDGVD
jgi:hypothetical protein